MKYKVEVVINQKVVKDYVFDRLSHPRQAVRKAVQLIGNKLNHYIMYIANEYGECWSYVVRKDISNMMTVRPMKKYGLILSRDDVDMIFTGNTTILGVIKR